jgi:hypothetical protein
MQQTDSNFHEMVDASNGGEANASHHKGDVS